ncbi:MarR family winged helix-turn-helix transcriptional regulator [Streptomyces nitrosporeus]|uniref:MarR family winged helix-turn-helix transcriptional regulator n=1 Tax=Streptomyces nitrosporeus TaxID=28894 RepID=UPI0039A2182A
MGRPSTYEVEYEQMLLSRYGLQQHRAGHGGGRRLERSAYVLLSRLRVQGPMSIGELSDALGLDASTLNRQTAAVVRARQAERIPDPAGGTARKFRITEEGSRLLDEERERTAETLERVMAEWPEQDVAAFAGYLKRFNAGIERLSGRPWPRP